MSLYEDESSNEEEDCLSQAREHHGFKRFGISGKHPNGLLYRSGDHIDRDNYSDDEGMHEKDDGYLLNCNTNGTARNSIDKSRNLKRVANDFRSSGSEFDGGGPTYLAQSKHSTVCKGTGKGSLFVNDTGDEHFKNESNGDEDFVISEEVDDTGDDGDENATYSGRFRKSLVTETLGKEKGKQNESTARANLKRESVSRHKYLKAQINEDNYGEEDDFEEVNGEK